MAGKNVKNAQDKIESIAAILGLSGERLRAIIASFLDHNPELSARVLKPIGQVHQDAIESFAERFSLSSGRLQAMVSFIEQDPELRQQMLSIIFTVEKKCDRMLDSHEMFREYEGAVFNWIATQALEKAEEVVPELKDTLATLRSTIKQASDCHPLTGRLALSVALLQTVSASLEDLRHLVPQQKSANELDVQLWQATQVLSATLCYRLQSAIAHAIGLPSDQATAIIEHIYELHRLIAVATDRQWDGHTEDAAELLVGVAENLRRLPADPIGQTYSEASTLAQALGRHRLAAELATGFAELKKGIGVAPRIQSNKRNAPDKAKLKVNKLVDAYRTFWNNLSENSESLAFGLQHLRDLPHIHLDEQEIRWVLGSLDYLTRVWELGMTHDIPPLEPDAPWTSPICEQAFAVLWKGGADGGPKRAAFRVAAFSPNKRPRALENMTLASSEDLHLSYLLEQCLDRARSCDGLFASITPHRDAWLPVHDGLPTLTLKFRRDREESPHVVFRAGDVCWLPVTGPCAWMVDFLKGDIIEHADRLADQHDDQPPDDIGSSSRRE